MDGLKINSFLHFRYAVNPIQCHSKQWLKGEEINKIRSRSRRGDRDEILWLQTMELSRDGLFRAETDEDEQYSTRAKRRRKDGLGNKRVLLGTIVNARIFRDLI